jgi:MarR family transcriptional regulator, organic hydroperoxide resistance regulator
MAILENPMLTEPAKRKAAVAYSAGKPAIKAKRRLDHGGLDDHLGFQLRLAYVAVSRHFARAMDRLDLTQKQTGVLWLIGHNGGVSQTAVATELGMDRASMMAIIDRLEERALVTRERSEHDARRQALHLTPKGRRLLAQAKAALARHDHWLTQRYSPAELSVLRDFIAKMYG